MKRYYGQWFALVSVVLILFGLVYATLGLRVLPVPADALLQWESYLYGAIMIGWGLTLLLVGRIAFNKNDRNLKMALLAGLAAWLVAEAIASAFLGVWFNVGVDAGVLALFALPLLKKVR